MDVALEFEDDLFFADLSKQISLLIMDDDEIPISNWNSSSLQPQVVSETVLNQPMTQASSLYEQSCRREMSKGTGVFIPKLSQPRRKGNRQGRYSSFNSRSYKQISDTTRGPLSHNTNSNNSNSNNNNNYSFNPRKHYYVPN